LTLNTYYLRTGTSFRESAPLLHYKYTASFVYLLFFPYKKEVGCWKHTVCLCWWVCAPSSVGEGLPHFNFWNI